MKEVEVKAKVDSLEPILSALKSRGAEISEPIPQRDVIYANDNLPFNDSTPGRNFLRIRNQSGKIFLTLKQSLSNELDSLEHEVVVSDEKVMDEMLKTMGYKKYVEVKKIRRKTYIDKIEICLDEVEELGSFVEAEKISEDDSKIIQKELWELLRSLGIKDTERVTHGYDSLVYMKKQNML